MSGFRERESPSEIPSAARDLKQENISTGSWRRGAESNRRIKVLQTSPLPLGYRALITKLASYPVKVYSPKETKGLVENLERETGFEPATSTLARSHSTAELLPPDATIITSQSADIPRRELPQIHGGTQKTGRETLHDSASPWRSQCGPLALSRASFALAVI